MNVNIQAAFSELFVNDGLTVMGRGLGIELLFAKFLQYYSRSPAAGVVQRLVFCINASGLEQALCDLLLSEGAPPDQLPKTINNECNAAERAELYAEGGCFFVTSRILIVDLLDGKLDPEKISGMLVYDAHRISETSIDSFIIRVYREKNQRGFIKAFSEDPEALQTGSAKTERLLKTLYLTKLYLWPRFRAEVNTALERRVSPEVIEISVSLSRNMKAIQSAILVAMHTCVNELKRACPQLETNVLTLENGLFSGFDYALRSQLDPDWHRLSLRTKQLVTDISTLRKLLDYLVRYDAFSFYYLLLKLQAASSEQQFPPLWLTSEAANKIFTHAKERVYSVQGLTMQCAWMKSRAEMDGVVSEALEALQLEHVMEPALENPPKWSLFTQIVQEIRDDFNKAERDKSGFDTRERVLVVVKDELALTQLRDVLMHGTRFVMDQRFRWFVTQQSSFVRKRYNRSRTAARVARNVRAAAVSASSSSSSSSGRGRGTESETSAGVSIVAVADAELAAMLVDEDAEAERERERESCDSGFLGLGLSEQDVRALPREMQLMLLQERILRLSLPVRSAQQESNSRSSLDESSSSKKRSVHSLDPSTASNTTNKRARIETVYEEDMHTLRACFLDPDLHITMATHAQVRDNLCSLRDLCPRYVVLYDADVQFIRNIETYQSTIDEVIKLYFLVYEGSTEEHRYVGSLAKEKKAFEQLIRTKEHLVVSLPYHGPLEKESSSSSSGVATVTDSRTMAKKGGLRSFLEQRKIVIDVREFRSTLPSVLHSSNFLLVPRTIIVGDFVLSAEICVERKGISDLFQSFASGRLYNQAESMCKYYKYPCLLIEFSPDKPFCLITPNEITSDIQANVIMSKIVLLSQSFPALKIFWSRSPTHTAEIFKSVITNHEEVDVHKAITVGALLDNAGNVIGDSTEGAAQIDQQQDARAAAHEMLMSLPGINVHNFREVINKVENLAQLSRMTESELSPLIGAGNAKKLVAFFRQRIL